MKQHLKEYLPHFFIASIPLAALVVGIATNGADVDRKVAAMNAMTQQIQVATKQ